MLVQEGRQEHSAMPRYGTTRAREQRAKAPPYGRGVSGEEQKGWLWNQLLDGSVALTKIESETGDMVV